MSSKKSLTFHDHIRELRSRLLKIVIFFIVSFSVCYFFAAQIYDILLYPLEKLSNNNEARSLIYTGMAEAFISYMRLSFFIGILISFPYINYQIYNFLAPGLYRKEKKFSLLILLSSPILFYLGCFFSYYVIFPLAWKFFLSFENFSNIMPITLQARISEYLSFSMRIIIAFGLVFQIPVIIIILIKSGILNITTLIKCRKYIIILFFIIGAVITPPDIVSQIGIALPMYFLYELTILFCRKNKISNKHKKNDRYNKNKK